MNTPPERIHHPSGTVYRCDGPHDEPVWRARYITDAGITLCEACHDRWQLELIDLADAWHNLRGELPEQ
jgi:hypothetical protein